MPYRISAKPAKADRAATPTVTVVDYEKFTLTFAVYLALLMTTAVCAAMTILFVVLALG